MRDIYPWWITTPKGLMNHRLAEVSQFVAVLKHNCADEPFCGPRSHNYTGIQVIGIEQPVRVREGRKGKACSAHIIV